MPEFAQNDNVGICLHVDINHTADGGICLHVDIYNRIVVDCGGICLHVDIYHTGDVVYVYMYTYTTIGGVVYVYM